MQFSTGKTFALFPGHTCKPSFRHQWLPRTWSSNCFGLAHGGQCKLARDRPSALRQETGHRFCWHTSHLQIFSQNFLAHTECYSNILCNLSDNKTSVSVMDFLYTCHGLDVGSGRPAWAGGRIQRIGVHFWNGNTTQMSSINLGRTLRKLLAAFHTFQHQFSPDGNRNWCRHAAEQKFTRCLLLVVSGGYVKTSPVCSFTAITEAMDSDVGSIGAYNLPVDLDLW